MDQIFKFFRKIFNSKFSELFVWYFFKSVDQLELKALIGIKLCMVPQVPRFIKSVEPPQYIGNTKL